MQINPFSRRLRNRKARAWLYLNASGHCENCGKELPKDWHADHHIPWSMGGLTVMSNLRALCKQCNLLKGDTMPNSFEVEQLEHFKTSFPNAKNDRKCQIGAYNCIFERIVVSGEKTCSVFMATGTGKSDVVRYAALGLTQSKKFAGVWAFSPSVYLRDQLKGEQVEDIEAFFDRCQYPISSGISPFISVDNLESTAFRNDSVLESFTTQLLIANRNIETFLKRAKVLFNQTGLRPVAIFDESHLFSTDNEWGKAAGEMLNAGIPIVLITGTPYRSDHMKIPGFHAKEISNFSRPYIKTKRDSSNPLIIQVERGNSKVCRYELEADYEYSYQRAWEDDVILKPEPCFIDATEEISERYISEMGSCEANRLLRVFLMDERTIMSSVETTIKSIKLRKSRDPRCAAIVTSLSDDEFDENTPSQSSDFGDIHAKRIAREFKRQSPDLRVLVVTSNNNNDGLSRFEKMSYDVLIVKAMGTIGYNCPRIKTVLHLSNYRTLPAFVQLVNRGCRHYAKNVSYDIIMPKDKGMVLLWGQFEDCTKLVVEERIDIMDSIDEKEISSQDTSENNHTRFNRHESSFNPNFKRSSNDEIIEEFNQAFPDIACRLTQQERLSFFSKFSNTHGEDCLEKVINNTMDESTSTPLIDSNEEESRLRSEANDIAKEITNEILKIKSWPMKRYGQIAPAVWTRIKRDCGFSPNQGLDKLCGITNFQMLIEHGKRLKTELFKKPEDNDFDYERFLGVKTRRSGFRL